LEILKVYKENNKETLYLVYMDVWDPNQVTSLCISSYYVTFIDDTTRKTWVYCITNTFDVFYIFNNWKGFIKHETNKKLKYLKLDNGGEYLRKDFDGYYSLNGI